jgi:hypothetical protein
MTMNFPGKNEINHVSDCNADFEGIVAARGNPVFMSQLIWSNANNRTVKGLASLLEAGSTVFAACRIRCIARTRSPRTSPLYAQAAIECSG